MEQTEGIHMNQYLLSTYAVEGQVPGAPGTPAEMQAFMKRVSAIEEEMDTSGTFVFSGGLKFFGSDTATTVHVNNGEVVMNEGAFVESNTQIAGFYIINADNLDTAKEWAGKVAEATNHPIEVRPFHATGRLQV